ncbi:cytochrome P450 [Rhizopus microsporus]|uniref:NADPH--hemoprotein reductase n=1 Tax=Rhizopus microsporus TaxID=58291 RepID=A0A1X0RNU1_RHIZD|nr:cytochrome P450 [Rhizopus microsporus]
MPIFRSFIAKRLGLFVPLNEILIYDLKQKELTDMESIRQQEIIYISVLGGIKDKIPGPRKLPFIGNIYDLLPNLIEGLKGLFDNYGPIIDVSLFETRIISTNDPVIAEAFAKESEFITKIISGGLQEIKEFAGSGLFTSNTSDPDWQLAHKLLMPAFSPRAIKAYQREMAVIAQQTIKVFESFSPEEPVEILKWTTNLTFETIGKVGFGYDFHLLDSRDTPQHPFIIAMNYCLKQAFTRFKQPRFIKRLPLEMNYRFDRELNLMHRIVDEVVLERKNSPDAKNSEKDLLGFMLNARDEHNLGLSDENIRDQIVTFLIAGHETTSATLAFTFYEFARNPSVQQKVLQEIADAGITHDKIPSPEQINKLRYLRQCMKETLRLYTPVQVINKTCIKDCVVSGGYLIKGGTAVTVTSQAMHWNPKVYPEPYKYDPDRWSPEEEQKRSRFAWLPFSNGPRACIGMAFAIQEFLTVVSMLLSRFEFKYDGPPIQRDSASPTARPLNFFVHIHPRTNMPKPCGTNESGETIPIQKTIEPVMDMSRPISANIRPLPPITFLYGTQTATSQDYADQLAKQAANFGFSDITVSTMDKWKVLKEGKYKGSKDKHGDEELLVICTATYNGLPPDSAEQFDLFLNTASERNNKTILEGLLYTVFGCGNKQWRTYQQFPIKIDKALEELGAERFFPAGQGDADKDIDFDFQDWAKHFWMHTLQYYSIKPNPESNIVPFTSMQGQSDIHVEIKYVEDAPEIQSRPVSANATILARRELQSPDSGRSTCHIEIDVSKLPPVDSEALYRPGDHLEILPANSPSLVSRIAESFDFNLDAVFEVVPESLKGVSPRSLAAEIRGRSSVRDALTYYADLLSPPSRSLLSVFEQELRQVDPDSASRFYKLAILGDDNRDQYGQFITTCRTIADLSDQFPQVKRLDFASFLGTVHVMQPRRYSISSSSSVHGHNATITVGVVDDVVNDKHYPGLASSYLSQAPIGSPISASFRSSSGIFSLPDDPRIPLILVAAGTGIAPFMGFLQERSLQPNAAPSTLFFGCRHPEHDHIYKKELDEFLHKNVLSDVHVVFSRLNSESSVKYVQHEILQHDAALWELLQNGPSKLGAHVYVCGAGAMSKEVRKAFGAIAVKFGEKDADGFINRLIEEKRYREDVWG